MHQVLNRTVAVAKNDISTDDSLFHDEGTVCACAFAMRATMHATTQVKEGRFQSLEMPLNEPA